MFTNGRVTLEVPTTPTYVGADAVCVARFAVELNGSWLTQVPSDARFLVKGPTGIVDTYPKEHESVKVVQGLLQLTVRPDEAAEWFVRIEGTLRIRGVPVLTPEEARFVVTGSKF